jgi:diguanylate cyclase (GGDEF)-like protein
VTQVTKPTLSTALDIAGARAYLADSRDRLIASSTTDAIGAAMPAADAAAAHRSNGSATVGATYVVSTAVAGTPWRVVLIAPTATLQAPLRSTARAAWELFAAFALAMLLVFGAGALALSRSARLAHERLHDPLTGLPNRALFLDRTGQALHRNRRRGRVATLFIDLDRFKPINDEFGHATGDALLRAVAERIAASVRADDVVSRFGGDEFLVLCERLNDEEQPVRIAERIRSAMTQPFRIDGYDLSLGCSIGVALQPVGVVGVDAQALVHQADLAMYRAKTAGRGRIEFCEALPLVTADAN